MSLKQLIGVDFGTSTSVIRVKRYEGNQPVGMERLGSEYVSFDGNSLVPTLIRTFKDGSAPYFGPDAEKDKKKSVLWDNFKMDLESTDPEKREQARKLTADFMGYLGKNYRNQFLSQKAEEEELLSLISFPVKWSEETRQFMLESASKAGFPNVVGMDEAQAAIGAVIVQNADYFVKSGLLKKGVPVNILMIDMGAGTTDLVLCSYTHGEEPKYEVREVWPKEGGIHFGGSEVDRILKAYFRGLLPEECADRIMGNKSLSLSAFKEWKEKNLSPALKRGEGVDTFSLFDEFAGLIMGEDEVPEYNLDRRTFEQEAAEYLRGFPVLVNECLEHAKAQGEDIDLVLLTGGHSQWYFIREMLTGNMTAFGTIELPKIKAEPERIISVPRPQETVALGLVYSPMVKQIQVSEPEPEKVQKKKPVVETETEKQVQKQGLKGNGMDASTHPQQKVKIEQQNKRSNSTPNQQGQKNQMQEFRKHGGTVVAVGCNFKEGKGLSSFFRNVYCGQCDVGDWKNIVSVACGHTHTVGLRSDGTVIAVGDNEQGQCNVGGWKNIIAVACGYNHTVGVRSDGTVVAVGYNHAGECNVGSWKNIVAVACGHTHTVGLRSDGTVIATGYDGLGTCNVGSWKDIVSVACGIHYTVGLRSDGTVVAVGRQDGESDVDDWQDIVAVACGNEHTVGLRSDGTVIAVGDHMFGNFYGQCNVGGWQNIVAVACGNEHTVGLKSDGTVIAVGKNKFGQCNVGDWKNIVAVACGDSYTVGLKSDGTAGYRL